MDNPFGVQRGTVRHKIAFAQWSQTAQCSSVSPGQALGSRRGDELPEELKRREDRIAKIQAAKTRLEAEAQARADAEQQDRDAATAQREAEGRSRKGKLPAPIDPTPDAKAQTNFTDPEAKIMKRSRASSELVFSPTSDRRRK